MASTATHHLEALAVIQALEQERLDPHPVLAQAALEAYLQRRSARGSEEKN